MRKLIGRNTSLYAFIVLAIVLLLFAALLLPTTIIEWFVAIGTLSIAGLNAWLILENRKLSHEMSRPTVLATLSASKPFQDEAIIDKLTIYNLSDGPLLIVSMYVRPNCLKADAEGTIRPTLLIDSINPHLIGPIDSLSFDSKGLEAPFSCKKFDAVEILMRFYYGKGIVRVYTYSATYKFMPFRGAGEYLFMVNDKLYSS